MLNGPSARLAVAGDTILVLSYCLLDEQEASGYRPKIVKVDRNNRPLS